MDQDVKAEEGKVGHLPVHLLRAGSVSRGHQVRFGHRMAELLGAGREGRGHGEDGSKLVHVPDRGAVLALRRSPGARVRRRAEADGASLLHEFGGAGPQEEMRSLRALAGPRR